MRNQARHTAGHAGRKGGGGRLGERSWGMNRQLVRIARPGVGTTLLPLLLLLLRSSLWWHGALLGGGGVGRDAGHGVVMVHGELGWDKGSRRRRGTSILGGQMLLQRQGACEGRRWWRERTRGEKGQGRGGPAV